MRSSSVAALKLQRERSSTYQQWTSQFHRALMGDIKPGELQRNIQGIILPEFQRISTALRSLQKSLTQQNSSDEETTSSAKSVTKSEEQRLAQWIDQLQDLEREHYGVTLSLANKLVEHCTPNVPSASTAPGSALHDDSKEKEANAPSYNTATWTEEEVVPTDMKSLFKPDDSDDEGLASGEVEWRETRSTGYPPAPTAASPAQTKPVTSAEARAPTATATTTNAPVAATLRVHDNGRCSLLRLIPPRYHTHLFFVDCRDGLDELDGASTNSDASVALKENRRNNGEATVDDGDGEEALLPVYAKESDAEGASRTQRGAPLGFYAPSAISHRCVEWSRAVGPIVRRQDALRAAIEDLCEELQSEISDM